MNSTLKKTLAGGLAAVTLGIAVASSSTNPAAAQGWGWGIAAGAATGLAIGALAARPYYYPPYAYGPGYGYPPPPGYYGPAYPAYYRACRVERRSTYDANGYFNGYRDVQVCR
jgi:hypothetical protein